MPSNPKADAVVRQWEILKLLPSRGAGIPASEVARRLAEVGHAVSKRTVERDLGVLSGIFAIDCNRQSVPWGWRFAPGFEPELPRMDLPEALTLVLAERVVRPAVPKVLLEPLEARFKRASEQLKAAGRSPFGRWKAVFRRVPETGPLMPPEIRPGILECIQEGLMNGKRMQGRYRSAGRKRLERVNVNPLGLVQKGPVFYLVGTLFDYDDVRLMAAHRFEDLAVEDQDSRRPNGFSLDAYLKSGAMVFGAEGTVDFKAEVSDRIVGYLEERPLAKDQRIVPDGEAFVVSARLPWTWELEFWILGQGPEIRVLAPAELREAVKDSVRRMYTRNLGEAS